MTDIQASAGGVSTYSPGDVEVEQDLNFAFSRTASLSSPAVGFSSIVWLGRSLGDLSLDSDGVTVRADASGTAVARVKAVTRPIGVRIATPGRLAGASDYTIVVGVKGRKVS